MQELLELLQELGELQILGVEGHQVGVEVVQELNQNLGEAEVNPLEKVEEHIKRVQVHLDLEVYPWRLINHQWVRLQVMHLFWLLERWFLINEEVEHRLRVLLIKEEGVEELPDQLQIQEEEAEVLQDLLQIQEEGVEELQVRLQNQEEEEEFYLILG